jgi:nucleotide-binding universal stress UspA family protein
MKFDVILCPVDFSEPSRQAFHYATAMAKWYAARVVALHVAHAPVAMARAGAGGGWAGDSTTTDFGLVRDRIREELPAPPDGVTVTPDATSGAPADAIVAYAQSAKPDLIVIGTRGTSGLKHLVLGSVTEDVLRTASCPVLAIPPAAGSAADFPLRRVLCATDFSATSLASLRAAAALTRDSSAEVTILHVLDDADENELFVARPYDVHRHGESHKAHVLESLQDFAGRPFKDQKTPQVRLAFGNADHEILNVAREMHADLVVMGVQGRNAMSTMLFGSTTNGVVRRAPCPVLTTHL